MKIFEFSEKGFKLCMDSEETAETVDICVNGFGLSKSEIPQWKSIFHEMIYKALQEITN